MTFQNLLPVAQKVHLFPLHLRLHFIARISGLQNINKETKPFFSLQEYEKG